MNRLKQLAHERLVHLQLLLHQLFIEGEGIARFHRHIDQELSITLH